MRADFVFRQRIGQRIAEERDTDRTDDHYGLTTQSFVQHQNSERGGGGNRQKLDTSEGGV